MTVRRRRQARERAISLLYEAEMKGVVALDVLAELPVRPDPFVVELIEGVVRAGSRIDELIGRHAVGWELGRMPPVDRSLLRVATFELLERPSTPVGVIIDEAVTLAGEYASESSGRFVNGVLGAIAGEVRNEGAANDTDC